MPELPEVETVARGLQKEVAGRRILSITIGKSDFIDNPADIERELPGRIIREVRRYGKFLLLRLTAAKNAEQQDEESALLVHLGMTGMLWPRAVSEPQLKHTHVVMLLDDGRELRFIDARRFGRIAYLPKEMLQKELLRFGADPLEVRLEEFQQRMHRRARVKALLLDQRVLRGVGNIYADESLWKARIHPAQLGMRLAPKQTKELYRALQDILKKAIVLRGSSISDFLDADGQPGEYQQHHRAYGREGKSCARCKTPIRRVIVAGRSSYFCPNCQQAPRLEENTETEVEKTRKIMRAVVQRVSRAKVTVEGQVTGEIGPGLMVLLGVGKEDNAAIAKTMAEKVANLRIFEDQQGKMNLSLLEVKGSALVVSQFTLYGNARGQRRPSFISAGPPELAKKLYDDFCEALRNLGVTVGTGIFQAMMSVELVNEGPVTILLDSDKTF